MPSWTSDEIVAAIIGGVIGVAGSILTVFVTAYFTAKGQRLLAASTQEAQDRRELRDAKLAVVRAMCAAEHQLGTFFQMAIAHPSQIDELYSVNEVKMNDLRNSIKQANVSLGHLHSAARDHLFNGPIRQLTEMDQCIDDLYARGGAGRMARLHTTGHQYMQQMLAIVNLYPLIADGRECPRLHLPECMKLNRELKRPPLNMIRD